MRQAESKQIEQERKQKNRRWSKKQANKDEKKNSENFAQRIRTETMDLNVYEVADVVAYLG